MFESKEPIAECCTTRFRKCVDPDAAKASKGAKNRLLSVAATVSIALCMSCSKSPAGTSAPTTSRIDQIKPPAENPFAVAHSRFAVRRAAPSGVGYASRVLTCGNFEPEDVAINEHLARAAIDRVFQEAGYQIERDYPYHQGDVALIADAYDVEKKIGYIFACRLNVDSDVSNVPTSGGVRLDFEARINDLLQSASSMPEREQLVRDIEAAKRLPDPGRREAAYRALLVEDGRTKISFAEMQMLERPREFGQHFIAVIGERDSRLTVTWDRETMLRRLDALGKNRTKEQVLQVIRSTRDEGELKTLERLEQIVREYIAWARSQGAQ